MDLSDYWCSLKYIKLPSRFDYLKDVYIIFIQQMRYNSHKQRLHK